MRRARAFRATALLAAVAAGAIIAVVALAGGTDDSRPTRDEYVAQVDALCAEYAAQLDHIPPPGDLSSPGAIVESLEQALPVLRAQATAIRALRPPRTDEARIERFFRLTDRSLAELQAALAAALERALYPMATALTRFGERRDEAKAQARELGFAC